MHYERKTFCLVNERLDLEVLEIRAKVFRAEVDFTGICRFLFTTKQNADSWLKVKQVSRSRVVRV